MQRIYEEYGRSAGISYEQLEKSMFENIENFQIPIFRLFKF